MFVQSAPAFNTSPGRYVLRTEANAHGIGGTAARVLDTFGVHGEIGDTDFSTFPYLPNQSANTRGVEGVNGSSGAGSIGVLGQIAGSSSPSSIAVYGVNSSTYAGPSPGGGG